MTQRIIITFLLVISISFSTYAQADQWKGKKCAVVLTYDDALNVHLDNAIPLLDSLGLKATFYLSAYFPGCKDRLTDWKKAAESGHELGNHTLFHPCNGKGAGRSWVSAERDLSTYSLSRMLDEIRMTNVFLQSLDGKTQRSFAYPCGDMHAGAEAYHDKIHGDFVSARGVKSEMIPADEIDMFNVGSYMIDRFVFIVRGDGYCFHFMGFYCNDFTRLIKENFNNRAEMKLSGEGEAEWCC